MISEPNSSPSGIAASWYSEHMGWMRRRARAKLGPEASEEVVQETFAKVCKRGHLEDVENPAGFLSRVLSNEIVAYYRKPSRRETCLGGIDNQEFDSEWPGESISTLEDGKIVRDSISSLKPRQRQAMLMFGNGKSRDEIASAMNMSAAAVTHLLARAKGNLKREITRRGYVPSLLPLDWRSLIRRRISSSLETLARLGQSLEPVALTMTIMLVTSLGRHSLMPDHSNSAESMLSNQIVTHELTENQTPPLNSENNNVHGARTTLESKVSDRLARVEHGKTWVQLDKSSEQRREPPPEQQLMDLLNDPSRALPTCPRTIPCPYD